VDETVITLEAGKQYTHNLQGPKDKVYEFDKFFQHGVFLNNQKFTKHSIMSYSWDLNASSTNQPGRFSDLGPTGTSGFGILMETTTFTKLEIPEQAGFVMPTSLPVGGKSQIMGNQKNSFAIKQWTVTQSGTTVRIGDETMEELPATSS